ncbi:Cullin 1a [Strongyloides ratti]|uniref:Cullin 1a n=1 Tax=Strongyloides ratti TaxID=34506 RepID=A0A090LKK1_STRRB|nr:Cullin 1a [Strongyloides ratti]CEF70208.1 Cullin 1a [Strongyloides ratti]
MSGLTIKEKETIEKNLREVFTDQPLCLTNYPPKKSMEFYTIIYSFCVNSRDRDNRITAPLAEARRDGVPNKGEVVGEEVYMFLKNFIIGYVKKLRQRLVNVEGVSLLELYVKLWDNFFISATVANTCFSYLNRFYITSKIEEGKDDVKFIKNMLINEFKEHIFFPYNHAISSAILDMINKERHNETINSSLIFSTLQSYIIMGLTISEKQNQQQGNVGSIVYTSSSVQKDKIVKNTEIYVEFFEDGYLDATRAFYDEESTEYLQNHTVSQYLIMVENRINEEKDRCTRYMDSRTAEGLSTTLNKVLIEKHLDIFRKAFEEMVVDNKRDDLSRMYNLCKDIPDAKTGFTATLQENIITYGRKIIDGCSEVATQNPKIYVQKLLEIYHRFNSMVTDCFKKDFSLSEALDKACQEVINENSVTTKAGNKKKCAELVAKYADSILKKNSKIPDDEMKGALIDLTTIFKYIRDKDTFLNFYSRSYAKRLINDVSVGEEHETDFIGHLKNSCGFDFTTKLEKMSKDMMISRDVSKNFRDYLSNKGIKSFDFSTNILTNVSWPYKQTMSCTLPPSLNSMWKEFEKYYIGHHSGRKLNLLVDLSKGEIQSNCFERRHIFTCFTPQISILMMYNDKDETTFGEIKRILGTKDSDIKTMIIPLVKNELLHSLCKQDGSDINESTVFSLNTTFTNKKVKIDLTRTGGKAETAKEAIAICNNVESDRKCLLEAIIVRVMKTRKELKHQQLLVEVISQIEHRFKPEVAQIKKCIDALIEKEYLKRKENDKETYEYLA